LASWDDRSQPLNHGEGLVLVGVRQRDDELLAPIAGDHLVSGNKVRFAQLYSPRSCQLREQQISRAMAVLIVELLEVIEVEHDRTHVGPVASCAREFARELLVEGATVGQAS